jgi:acetyl-CoA carboxylase biotin carboxyl carrier protein
MNLEDVYEFMNKFEQSSISEIQLEIDGTKISCKKGGDNVNTLAQSYITIPNLNQSVDNINLKGTNSKDSVKMDNSKDLEIKDEDTLVRAKVAGTFYRAESPDSTPFVQVGQKVKKGDVLGMIEAMKMMNNITSPIDGEVLDIVAGNEDLVGYDDILIVLKKV